MYRSAGAAFLFAVLVSSHGRASEGDGCPVVTTTLAAETKDCACGFDWSKLPPYRPFPRPGFFPIFPKGPGYYTLVDAFKGNCSEAPPKMPYPAFTLMPQPFYDADFRYVDDPKIGPQAPLDRLHRIKFGDDNWLFSTGGEIFGRHMHEVSSRLTGRNNVYDLLRVRAYADLWYHDQFRVFGEFIDAQSVSQDLNPLPPDVDRYDIQNLFVDWKLGEPNDGKAYLRVGRQELLYGSQRLISPPPWNNARRTFEGVKAFWTSEKLDIDAFWVQPIIPQPNAFNSSDHNQNFAGVWSTYRPKKGQAVDLYALVLDNDNRVTGQGIVSAPTTVQTYGGRYSGDQCGWLWDVETMLQLGKRGGQRIQAGSANFGLGRNWSDLPGNPTFWTYYEFASGDKTPNADNYNTFNQLYPFAHYYFGWIDQIARQNVHDVHLQMYVYPAKWCTLWLQYHHFWLASKTDALYADGGPAIRRDATGASGNNIGDEIDIIANIHVSARADIMLGYSVLFPGRFVSSTGSGTPAELYHVGYSLRW